MNAVNGAQPPTQPPTMTSSAGEAAVSPPFVPEKFSEHTQEFGQAVIELMAPAEPREAAKIFSRRLEGVAQSLEHIYQDANSSALSINHAAEEAFRRHYELGMHFLEDLVMARSPAEAMKLQFNFLNAQFQLFAQQASDLQRQFARTYLTPPAKKGPAQAKS